MSNLRFRGIHLLPDKDVDHVLRTCYDYSCRSGICLRSVQISAASQAAVCLDDSPGDGLHRSGASLQLPAADDGVFIFRGVPCGDTRHHRRFLLLFLFSVPSVLLILLSFSREKKEPQAASPPVGFTIALHMRKKQKSKKTEKNY